MLSARFLRLLFILGSFRSLRRLMDRLFLLLLVWPVRQDADNTMKLQRLVTSRYRCLLRQRGTSCAKCVDDSRRDFRDLRIVREGDTELGIVCDELGLLGEFPADHDPRRFRIRG